MGNDIADAGTAGTKTLADTVRDNRVFCNTIKTHDACKLFPIVNKFAVDFVRNKEQVVLYRQFG